jgi:hypothetical protein
VPAHHNSFFIQIIDIFITGLNHEEEDAFIEDGEKIEKQVRALRSLINRNSRNKLPNALGAFRMFVTNSLKQLYASRHQELVDEVEMHRSLIRRTWGALDQINGAYCNRSYLPLIRTAFVIAVERLSSTKRNELAKDIESVMVPLRRLKEGGTLPGNYRKLYHVTLEGILTKLQPIKSI